MLTEFQRQVASMLLHLSAVDLVINDLAASIWTGSRSRKANDARCRNCCVISQRLPVGNFLAISGTAQCEIGIRLEICNEKGHEFHTTPGKPIRVTYWAGAWAIDVDQGLRQTAGRVAYSFPSLCNRWLPIFNICQSSFIGITGFYGNLLSGLVGIRFDWARHQWSRSSQRLNSFLLKYYIEFKLPQMTTDQPFTR